MNEQDILKTMKNKIEDIGNHFDKLHNKNFDFCICEEVFSFQNSIKEFEEVEEKYNKEFFFNCCCCCNNCSCSCCCKNEKAKNDPEIKKEIEKIDDLKREKIDKNLEIITENNNESNNFSCCRKLFYMFFSLFHFYAISELYSVQFAFYREIGRSFSFLFGESYIDQKCFDEYYRNSIKRDVSQINISYFTSFFTSYLVKKFDIWVVYLVCLLFNFTIMLLFSFFEFLPQEDIRNNVLYPGSKIVVLLLGYILIYIFTGIISFMPVLLLNNINDKKNPESKQEDWLNNIIIIFPNTFSVIIKIIIHTNLNISLFFCSFIFLVNSLIYLLFLIYILSNY